MSFRCIIHVTILLATITIVHGTSRFIAVNLSKNWTDAQQYCQSTYGTSLATILSDYDNHEARYVSSKEGISSGDNLWIGLSDIDKEGTFIWEDGTGEYNDFYNHFSSGQPDNNEGNEHCVEIKSSKNDYWNDAPCFLKYSFICNYPFSYIAVNSIKLNFSDSQMYCQNNFSTNLATIFNGDNNNIAFNTNSNSNDNNSWIGLYDKYGNNKWNGNVWIDNISDIRYTNWDNTSHSINNVSNISVCGKFNDESKWQISLCNKSNHFICNNFSGNTYSRGQFIFCTVRVFV